MKKVCHISTLHQRYDVRVFEKELKSLSYYYKTFFIVADGLGDETTSGTQILDLGRRHQNRIKRAKLDSNKALLKALKVDADLYHLHDPELMGVALKLKEKNKKVIFDAHEDLPQQIMTKEYIPAFLRRLISNYYQKKETTVSKKIDAIVAATPTICDKFKSYGARSITVCNYPKLTSLDNSKTRKENHLVYIGGISEARGIITMLDALNKLDCKLKLAGKFFDVETETKAKSHPAWSKVIWYGFVDTAKIKEILQTATIGLVILKEFKSYQESLPVKMFEYMNAGIPFIASNFTLWEDIATMDNCGICVNPEDTDKIVDIIQQLLSNLNKRKMMGENGQKAVNSKYNWKSEEAKLVKLYKTVLN